MTAHPDLRSGRRPSWRVALVTLALTAAGLVVPSTAASAVDVPAAGGTYVLRSAASGKCLEVAGGSTTAGALLTAASCVTGAARQQWRLEAQGSAVRMVNVATDRCADVPGSTTTSGVQLVQWPCGTTKANQTWGFSASAAASGKVRVVSRLTGRCVSVKDGSTASGAAVVQETCSDVARMQWTPTTVSAPPATTGPTVAADGSGTYTTVQAAIDAAPSNSSTRTVITIAPGTYRGVVTVPSTKTNVTLRGTGASAADVRIVYGNSAGTHGTFNSATAFLDGTGVEVENLTIANDYVETTSTVDQQAVALHLKADRAVLRNVRLLGDQDTFLVNETARAYVVDSYVEGTVDFIFGAGTAVFDRTTVNSKRATGGPITAASTPATKTYGFLFYKSTITGSATGVTTLGRPWRPDGQVLYRESTLGGTVKTSQPWTDMSSNSWKDARFFEYQNTGPGAGTGTNRPQLASSAASQYTPEKYLAGTDGWDPVG